MASVRNATSMVLHAVGCICKFASFPTVFIMEVTPWKFIRAFLVTSAKERTVCDSRRSLVCLFVSKITEKFRTDFKGDVDHGPRKSWLNYGGTLTFDLPMTKALIQQQTNLLCYVTSCFYRLYAHMILSLIFIFLTFRLVMGLLFFDLCIGFRVKGPKAKFPPLQIQAYLSWGCLWNCFLCTLK